MDEYKNRNVSTALCPLITAFAVTKVHMNQSDKSHRKKTRKNRKPVH